jgi:hypothetical protein
MAEFAHNNHVHSATRTSPFKALYGYNPDFQVAPRVGPAVVPKADERLEELRAVQEECKAALKVAAERMKYYYDRSRADAPDFKVGDKVWLDARNVALTGTRKLSPRRLGPFEVLEKIGDLNYRLRIPATWRIHPVFHVTLLLPHAEDTIPGRTQPPPPPVTVQGEVEYEVEAIRDSRIHRGQLQYLVRWKGFSPADDTWEPERNVANAPEKLAEFHRAYPSAPRRLPQAVLAGLQFVPRPEPLVDYALCAHPRRGVISGLRAHWR